MEDVTTRASELLKIINGIGKPTELTDQKVRQYLLNSKNWDIEVNLQFESNGFAIASK